jgi:hypothetical protein
MIHTGIQEKSKRTKGKDSIDRPLLNHRPNERTFRIWFLATPSQTFTTMLSTHWTKILATAILNSTLAMCKLLP